MLEYKSSLPLALKVLYIFVIANRISERLYAPVAQLDRALACGAKGRTFESCRVYQLALSKQLFVMEELFFSVQQNEL